MIIISGTLSIDTTKKDDLLAAMKVMQEASQAEDGCMHYHFYTNHWDDGQLFLYEEWESAESLAAHGQSDHMKVWREASAGMITGRNLKRMNADEGEAL